MLRRIPIDAIRKVMAMGGVKANTESLAPPPPFEDTHITVEVHHLNTMVWVKTQYDPAVMLLCSGIAGSAYNSGLRRFGIPYEGFKQFILTFYKDTYLRKKFWPIKGMETEVQQIIHDEYAREKIQQINPDDLTIPPHLVYNGLSPRTYQYQASMWMVESKTGILAFDMGLGKTSSSINALKLLRLKTPGACMLVVTTASTKWSAWETDIKKFSDFSYVVVDGSKDERNLLYKSGADIVIMNYDLLWRDELVLLKLMKQFDVIVADEATHLKNRTSKRTRIFRKLAKQTEYIWLLTGTPFENSVTELFTLCTIIAPGVLGNWQNFVKNFMVIGGNNKVGFKNLKLLSDLVHPVMFRRTKEQVKEQLPEVTRMDVSVFLTTEQKRTYNLLRKKLRIQVESWDEESMTSKTSFLEINGVLAQLTRMKQLCDSPLLLGLEEDTNPKIDTVRELLNEQLLGQKVILFTQYAEMAKILYQEFLDLHPVLMTGAVSPKKRASIIEEFQQDPQRKLFIMTTAGSQGITLTAASAVIMYDMLWNPKMMDQIVGRAHRIGNEHDNLLVIYLLARRSIEEKIARRLEEKSKLFDAVIDGDELALAEYNKLNRERVKDMVLDVLEHEYDLSTGDK